MILNHVLAQIFIFGGECFRAFKPFFLVAYDDAQNFYSASPP